MLNFIFTYRLKPHIQVGFRRQERLPQTHLHAKNTNGRHQSQRILLQNDLDRRRQYI